MSRETTDTGYGNELTLGKKDRMVEKVERKMIGTKKAYVWKFSWAGDDGREFGEIMLFPGSMGEILRALGCKETSKDRFDWDTELVIGTVLNFDVTEEPSKKDPSKIYKTISDVKRVADDKISF